MFKLISNLIVDGPYSIEYKPPLDLFLDGEWRAYYTEFPIQLEIHVGTLEECIEAIQKHRSES